MVTLPQGTAEELKSEIMQIVNSTHHFLYTAGTLYEFMPSGIYIRAEDHQVESYLAKLSLTNAGIDLFLPTDKARFLDDLKSRVFMRWEDVLAKQDKNLIPFLNTIFNIKEFKPIEIVTPEVLREHYFFYQIPHNLNKEMFDTSINANYTPEQALQTFSPHIYAFFKDIVGEDKVILQLAKIGYTFYPSNPYKLMFMELGPKDAGKTTFLKLFTYVIGERNISTISLQDLADYRFARAELWGKLANIYDDLPTTAIKNQGIIKMLSGESRIDAPIKYKQEIQSFVNTAKSIYTTNRLPFIADSTDEAFFSRWIITNYPNHFPRNDKFFSNLIANESEIEGLIVASLLALRDLLAKKFQFEDKTQENMELWQKQNNSIYAFVVDSVRAGIYALGDNLKIEKDELYQAYTDYCNDMDLEVKSKTKFTQDLQRLFGIRTTTVKKDGKQVWGYAGIGVKVPTQTELDHELTQSPNQNSNATTPQEPSKPNSNPPDPTKPDNTPTATKSSINPHLDIQAQSNQQVSSPIPAGSVLEPTTQNQKQNMVMLTKTMEKEAPETMQEREKPLTREEIIQKTFVAVKLSEKYSEPFWEDIEPNKKLYPALQGLTTGVIQEALKTLQEEGYIMQVKPNYWHAVKDLHLVDILAYDNPDMPVYCPNCMKPVTRLYWYDTEWLCVDCLNARQHQNDDLYA